MIFGFLFKWGLRLVLPTLIVAGVLLYFGWGLQNASLEEFRLNGIKDITTDSFTFDGTLFVKNPSDISIPVKSVKYVVIVKETGEVIGEGDVGEFTLEKQVVSKIPFTQEIKWVPTAELALDLITKDEVYVIVRGNLTLDIRKVEEYQIPFEAEQDIRSFVEQFVPLDITEDLPFENIPLVRSQNGSNNDSLGLPILS